MLKSIIAIDRVNWILLDNSKFIANKDSYYANINNNHNNDNNTNTNNNNNNTNINNTREDIISLLKIK